MRCSGPCGAESDRGTATTVTRNGDWQWMSWSSARGPGCVPVGGKVKVYSFRCTLMANQKGMYELSGTTDW